MTGDTGRPIFIVWLSPVGHHVAERVIIHLVRVLRLTPAARGDGYLNCEQRCHFSAIDRLRLS